jgi:hypothetical protein
MIDLLYLIEQEIQKDILMQKIKNPVTGRLIKISSALTYPEDKEVYKLAKKMIDNSDEPSKNNILNKKSK